MKQTHVISGSNRIVLSKFAVLSELREMEERARGVAGRADNDAVKHAKTAEADAYYRAAMLVRQMAG